MAFDFPLTLDIPVPADGSAVVGSSNFELFFFLAELSTFRVAGFENDLGDPMFG